MKKKKWIVFLIYFIMITCICPVNALDTSNQIGNYFEADNETGELSASPTLTSENTTKSYADEMVMTNKTINATNTENVFEITLDVRTKEEIKHYDLTEDAAVVLVFDLSNSMDGDRLAKSKEAAKSFINSFKDVDAEITRKVAIVGFSGQTESGSKGNANYFSGIWGATTYLEWVNANDDSINAAIDSMTAKGATCLEAGLILANNLLQQDAISSISNKNIILLSDGKPTYGLNSSAQKTSTDKIGNPLKEANEFYYDSQGGQTTMHSMHTSVETIAMNCLSSGINTYAIYLGNDVVKCTNGGNENNQQCQLNKVGSKWLKEDCHFITYSAEDSELESLGNIFTSISELIQLQARAWITIDPIGSMFEFIDFSVNATNSNMYYFNNNKNEITWDLRQCSPLDEKQDGYNVYQLKYKVKLNTLANNYTANTFYPTNGVTSVIYVINQINGEVSSQIKSGTAYFNVPSAKGYAANVEFQKVDEENNPLAGATFTLTTTDNPNWKMEVTSTENGTVLFENVPSGHKYSLQETKAPIGFEKNEDSYDIEVAYGVLSGIIGTNNVVENVRTPQYGSLTITKEVTGEGGDDSKAFEFTVKLTDKNDLPISGIFSDITFDADGKATIDLQHNGKKTISGLPEGAKYSVVETADDDYTSTSTGATGTILANLNVTAAFINTYIDKVVELRIPFIKKVTLGGDIAPNSETFKFEIFDIGNGNIEDYNDIISYTAEVTVNGAGEFNGEIVLTGVRSKLEQFICEGIYIREVKGDATNWTYSDEVWNVIPEWNDNEERVFMFYPTTKEVVDHGDYIEEYYINSDEAVEKMTFENIYTENKPTEPIIPIRPNGNSNSPQTGDSNLLPMWIMLLFISGGLTSIYFFNKKSKKTI